MSSMQNFSINLRVAMKRQGLNQKSLAALSGVSQSQISYIVREEKGTKPEIMDKLSEALGVKTMMMILPPDEVEDLLPVYSEKKGRAAA